MSLSAIETTQLCQKKDCAHNFIEVEAHEKSYLAARR